LFLRFLLPLLFLVPFALSAQDRPVKPIRAGACSVTEICIGAVTQKQEGDFMYLRGECKIETTETLIRADEIDYNTQTHWAYARGHVHFESFDDGDKLDADHGEYNLQAGEGKFYVVSGTSPSKVNARRGVLSTSNPFYFKGDWLERIKDKYVLHDGFVTDCKLPKPWWTLSAPLFDIIPDDRAIAHHTIFRIKRVPIFYATRFYRPLGRNPRKSGFLTPNIGNSTTRGFMLGAGYYLVLGRSYDVSYRIQDFTQRGFAHTAEFRGKPSADSYFDVNFYGVQDKGQEINGEYYNKAPGFSIQSTGKADTLPLGFEGKFNLNYVSSFLFRQTFSESFNEAISGEVNSTAYAQRHWTNDVLTILFKRNELFESTVETDKIVIQKLPEVDFNGRDRTLANGPIPLWFSFDSSMALARRQEPTFQTPNFVPRLDFYPTVSTAFSFANFHLTPSFSIRETFYGDSMASPTAVSSSAVVRSGREFNVDLRTPSLAKVFKPPKMFGVKAKHVIEPYAKFKYIGGISNFDKIIRLDANDVYADTTQLEFGVIQHLYVKDKAGNISELASWSLAQQRYFNTDFGGALIPGERNVFDSTEELTGFAFLAGPRHYSPIVSDLKFAYQRFYAEWRADYDPLLGRVTANSITAGVRYKTWFANVGQRDINGDPTQISNANQLQTSVGYGSNLRRGFNAVYSLTYDYIKNQLLYTTVQASYNTDCCGFSAQYQRINFGVRDEAQWRVSFQVANVGAYGTLRRQDSIF
jgi:LPS-assembly protein